mmetsp:Transcript_107/g.300  ORF Transcript_107/g.300 Transcript_107/m.300 type:complete len:319 (-) Transcript_107:265-1221(-)
MRCLEALVGSLAVLSLQHSQPSRNTWKTRLTLLPSRELYLMRTSVPAVSGRMSTAAPVARSLVHREGTMWMLRRTNTWPFHFSIALLTLTSCTRHTALASAAAACCCGGMATVPLIAISAPLSSLAWRLAAHRRMRLAAWRLSSRLPPPADDAIALDLSVANVSRRGDWWTARREDARREADKRRRSLLCVAAVCHVANTSAMSISLVCLALVCSCKLDTSSIPARPTGVGVCGPCILFQAAQPRAMSSLIFRSTMRRSSTHRHNLSVYDALTTPPPSAGDAACCRDIAMAAACRVRVGLRMPPIPTPPRRTAAITGG